MSDKTREAAQLPSSGPAEFRVRESISRPGWWVVSERTGSSIGEVVASVFGLQRAEIVRDAFTSAAAPPPENGVS